MKALEKLCMVNPGTSLAVKASIAPLMTKVNRPKVKSCRGKVKNEKIGRTRVLTRPQTSAAQIAVEKLAKWRPGIKRVIRIRPNALIDKRINKPIIISDLLFCCIF